MEGLPVKEEELVGLENPERQTALRRKATRRLKRGFYGEAIWIYQKIFQVASRVNPKEALSKGLKDFEKLRAYAGNIPAIELLRDLLKLADEIGDKRREKLFNLMVDLWISGIKFEIRRTLYYFEEAYIWLHHDRPHLKNRMEGFFERAKTLVRTLIFKMFKDLREAIQRAPERRAVLPELKERMKDVLNMIFYLGDMAFYERIQRDLEKLYNLLEGSEAKDGTGES